MIWLTFNCLTSIVNMNTTIKNCASRLSSIFELQRKNAKNVKCNLENEDKGLTMFDSLTPLTDIQMYARNIPSSFNHFGITVKRLNSQFDIESRVKDIDDLAENCLQEFC